MIEVVSAARVYVGVDPGKSGALAAVYGDGLAITRKLPECDRELLELIADISGMGLVKCVLEKVHSMPRDGVKQAFSFGCEYGRVRMALASSGWKMDEVRPQKWQKEIGGVQGGDGKRSSRIRARQLFPQHDVTVWNSDALLIAEYARRMWATPSS